VPGSGHHLAGQPPSSLKSHTVSQRPLEYLFRAEHSLTRLPRLVAEQRPLTLDGHGVLLKRRKGGAGGAGREVRDLSH
jgi:hypothetical protein